MNDNTPSFAFMLRLDSLWHNRNRSRALIASGVIVLAVATVDWWIKSYLALGFLYLLPIVLAAAFLPRWIIILLGAICAVLAESFSYLELSLPRLCFVALAFVGIGLFAGEVARNRRLMQHSETRLRNLVETSPAGIVTVDDRGIIELANRAAVEVIAPRHGDLIGDPIAAYIPNLHLALRWEEASQFRTLMQCTGHRGDGEVFTADIWFSTYKDGPVAKLAAIIAEVHEEDGPIPRMIRSESNGAHPQDFDPLVLTSRETEVLRLVVQGESNKAIAGSMDISESSVKKALQQLFARTGVRTRSQLVRVALERYGRLL